MARDPIKETKQDAKKIARSITRLKYSLAADREIRNLVEEIDQAVDEAFARGDEYELDIPELLGLPRGTDADAS